MPHLLKVSPPWGCGVSAALLIGRYFFRSTTQPHSSVLAVLKIHCSFSSAVLVKWGTVICGLHAVVCATLSQDIKVQDANRLNLKKNVLSQRTIFLVFDNDAGAVVSCTCTFDSCCYDYHPWVSWQQHVPTSIRSTVNVTIPVLPHEHPLKHLSRVIRGYIPGAFYPSSVDKTPVSDLGSHSCWVPLVLV